MKLSTLLTTKVARRAAEATIITIIMVTTYLFLHMRTEHRCFPDGDEGSWMSVAAQLARGEGFTTRWYEHPFLKHTTLPRPDDFRYPGLSVILAAAFRVGGISYPIAQRTTTLLFLLFLTLYYFIVRRKYSRSTALISLMVSGFSLLQLYWNSEVYSEGLFAIGTALLFSIVWFFDRSKISTWVYVGLSICLLYYIRLNGILFLAGLPVYYFFNRHRDSCCLRKVSIAGAVFIAGALPWMLRSLLLFDNPLHVAGGAGVLRLAANDPRTWSLFEFIAHYNPIILLNATVTGAGNFLRELHYFDKNLFILPVAGAAAGIIRQRLATSPLIASGFILTLLACFFISNHESWAGVRYASALLPFIYAKGIHELVHFVRVVTARLPYSLRALSPILPGMLLISTLYYPHEYYLRHFKSMPRCIDVSDNHTRRLTTFVPKGGCYLADAYGQFSFMSERNCVGIQGFVDSTAIPLYLDQYSPHLIVLTRAELEMSRIQGIIQKIRSEGYQLDTASQSTSAVYLQINKPSDRLPTPAATVYQ